MAIERDEAVILRLTEFSETSQIATLFTRGAGRVALIAKGARRSTGQRFAAGLDTLEYGEVRYVPVRGEAQLGTLTDWSQRDLFPGLREELARLYGALYCAELVASLTAENDPHPDLFDGLVGALRAVAEAGQVARTVAQFQSLLLAESGLAPNLDSCVSCGMRAGRGGPMYFSSAAGGLLCRDCEMHFVEKRLMPAGLLEARGTAADPVAWLALLHYHLTNVAGHAFKTASQLAQALQIPRL